MRYQFTPRNTLEIKPNARPSKRPKHFPDADAIRRTNAGIDLCEVFIWQRCIAFFAGR